MTREEAINEIKSWAIPSERGREVLETLIPELRESEDERIRKWIIDFAKGQIDGFSLVDDEECNKIASQWRKAIAYLEKQKNLISYYEDKLDRCACENLDKGIKAVLNHPEEYGLEKQKEQKPEEKPINWTELTWKDINKLEGIINNVHYEFRNGIGEESFGKEVLEKFREYKGDEYLDEIEQKPTEWSEEDEAMLKVAIAVLRRYSHDDVANWLKSLPKRFNLQPKKELSIEKAIQWLDDTFYFLDNSSGRGRDCEITTHDFDSLEEMYDSFRKAVTVDAQPSWKPSEEQMEAMERASTNKYLSAEQYDILVSLYEQLKKLI